MIRKKTNYVLVQDGEETRIMESDDYRLDGLACMPGKYRKDTTKKIKEQYGKKAIGIFDTLNGETYIVYTNHHACKC